MEIAIINDTTKFAEIENGVIFMRHNKTLYVKMDRIGEYNAVKLNDGQLAGFGNEEIVTKAKKVEIMF